MGSPISPIFPILISMPTILRKFAESVLRLNTFLGQKVSWLSFALVLLIGLDVTLRYALGMTRIWVIELETYLFSLLFLLGGPWTWARDEHVRVDIFYTQKSPKQKRRINLFGHLLLFLPWTWILMQVGWQFFYESWLIREGSAQAGGLPALYVIKFAMLLGFVLLFLQGVAHTLLLLLNWNQTEDSSWQH